jgi:hypothetical protein
MSLTRNIAISLARYASIGAISSRRPVVTDERDRSLAHGGHEDRAKRVGLRRPASAASMPGSIFRAVAPTQAARPHLPVHLVHFSPPMIAFPYGPHVRKTDKDAPPQRGTLSLAAPALDVGPGGVLL